MNKEQFEQTMIDIAIFRKESVKKLCNSRSIYSIQSLLLNLEIVLMQASTGDGVVYSPYKHNVLVEPVEDSKKEYWFDYVAKFRKVPTPQELYEYIEECNQNGQN